MNRDLIDMMVRCDGKRGTCKSCDYREHPACREAMAREASAEMLLAAQQLEIAKQMLGKVIPERDEALEVVNRIVKACEVRDTLIKTLFADLDERRDCLTCKYEGSDKAEEQQLCEGCRAYTAGSAWMPKDKYCMVKPVEDDAGDEDVQELTELPDTAE